MSFNRSAIFKAAWATAKRRKAVYVGTLREHFRAGLQMAWWDAKEAVRIAGVSAARAAREAAAFAARSDASLCTEILTLANADFLGHEGMERLAQVKAALSARTVSLALAA